MGMLMKMNLFVWEGVLSDYTDGLVVAMARDEDEAWELLFKKDSIAWWKLNGNPKCLKGKDQAICAHKELRSKGVFHTEQAIRPKKITKPEAFVVWGGS